ncbi:MAG: hypothetical protein IPJ61_20200 [Tessaracoccus sp.]|uniref:hypothetical protein n=1 Tax=Tessaracoccus sp. TaxID=1971211 RepID=UPI001ECFC195|nr:hypothetical protein [Tessaracoccus sp.]MBK7823310.1 hypothetical protein [Tessaracoccus sp.]
METFDEAIRFLSELCDEHNAMMRSKHWLPTGGNREMHERRELGICDALVILREHNDMQEGRIESLTAALNERDDEQEHVDVFADEPEDKGKATDFGDETEAMERFEKAQREADTGKAPAEKTDNCEACGQPIREHTTDELADCMTMTEMGYKRETAGEPESESCAPCAAARAAAAADAALEG